jgi:hypothetical protein
VILGGPPAAPRVIARERLELAAPELEGSRQPYHALAGLPLAQARARLAQFENSAAELAFAQLRALTARAAADGHETRAAALLDSAGRSAASLEAILASHALIHTADGHHFRAALASACERLGLPISRIPARELTDSATAVLRQPPERLAAAVAALGRELGPPWGADQKSAALLAWLKLAALSFRAAPSGAR